MKEDFTKGNFYDDYEKMRDFRHLTKAEFLQSYSYLTEEEYENTLELYNRDRTNLMQHYLKISDVIDELDVTYGILLKEYDRTEDESIQEKMDRITDCIDDLEHAMYTLCYGEEK